MSRHAAVLLGVGGLLCLAAGLWLARPLSWLQVALLVFGTISLMASPPVARTYLRALMSRSRERSPATRASRKTRPAVCLLYGLWFLAAISFGEMAYLTYAKEISRYRVLGWEFMWRIPMGYAVLLGGAALVCYLLARRRPERDYLSGLVFIGVFIGACGWLLLVVKGLYYWTALVLSVGIAAQVSRLAYRHAYLSDLVVRRTAPAATLLVAALAAGFFGWPLWTERQALGRLPAVAASDTNVLLIVLDTVRAKSLSLYGYHRATTPNLDRFAARGLVFDRATATAPWTLPSHGSMFTGRWPHELGGGFAEPLNATHPTLAEALGRQGYLTAGFVANHHYVSAKHGLARGFARFEDERTSLATALGNTSFGLGFMRWAKLRERFGNHENFGRKSAEQVSRSFLAWLSRQDGRRPFFAFLNFNDAHSPYAAPGEFAHRFTRERPMGDNKAKDLDAWSPEEVRELNDAYDSAIAYLDDQLGGLFADLDARDVLADTVVIVTSDHGELFGEHGLMDHANSLYLPLLHVPLVVVHPARVPAGIRTDRLVSLRDLPATIFDLAGLADPLGFPGASLLGPRSEAHNPMPVAEAPVLSEAERLPTNAYPASYPASKGRMSSIVFRNMHYIVNHGTGQEELFNIARDPDEIEDRAATEPTLVEAYRGYLRSLVDRAPKGRR